MPAEQQLQEDSGIYINCNCAAQWPRAGVFQGDYPRGYVFQDRWYQLGDRWYRFADEGFAVRAGFREHRIYFYAYSDVLRIERKAGRQRGQQAAGGAVGTPEGSTVDIWVTLRRRGAEGGELVDGSAGSGYGGGAGAAGGSYVVVMKGVDEWLEPGRSREVNTIWDFLVMQVDRWHAADAPAVAA